MSPVPLASAAFVLRKSTFETNVRLERFIPNPYQPVKLRSTPAMVEDLYGAVRESRVLMPEVCVRIPNTTLARQLWKIPDDWPLSKNYLGLADAHRRLMVAKKMGLHGVDAQIIDMDESESTDPVTMMKLFALLATNKTVTGAAYFDMWGKGESDEAREASLRSMPKDVRVDITAFVTTMGPAAALHYSQKEGGTSPAVASTAKTFVRACQKYHQASTINVTENQVCTWMLECKTKRLIDEILRRFKEDEDIVEDVVACIEKNNGAGFGTKSKGGRPIIIQEDWGKGELGNAWPGLRTAAGKSLKPVSATNMASVLSLSVGTKTSLF